MNYLVLIDESGPFKNDCDHSLVGGLITECGAEKIISDLRQAVEETNEAKACKFTMHHIHIAPLLHAEEMDQSKSREIKRFTEIPKVKRQYLVGKCFSAVRKIGYRFIVSYNKGQECRLDSQTRYLANLQAIIQKTVNCLKNDMSSGTVTIIIARRSKKCFISSEEWEEYHENLEKTIEKFVKPLTSRSINMHIRVTDESTCPEIRAADVACYMLGKKIAPSSIVLSTYPDTQKIMEIEKKAEKRFFNELLNSNRIDFLSVFKYSATNSERRNILQQIEKVNDKQVAMRNVDSLINHAGVLVDERAIDSNNLALADMIYQYIYNYTRLRFDSVMNDRDKVQWINRIIACMSGMIVCRNHVGDKEKQREIEIECTDLMNKNLELFSVRDHETIMLEIRNRAFNNDFNDYRFNEIIHEFEPVAMNRRKQIAKGYEPVTGKILGTIGQAYAFAAQGLEMEMQRDYRTYARSYLEDSLEYFHIGDGEHIRSIGYLTQILWEEGKNREALDLLRQQPSIAVEDSLCCNNFREDHDTAFANYAVRTLVGNNGTGLQTEIVFDLTMLLRIIVDAGIKLEEETYALLSNFLENSRGIMQHPFELLYKWVGLYCFRNNSKRDAEKWFDAGISFADKQGFTIDTIILPIMALKCLINDSGFNEVEKWLQKLFSRSDAFVDYIFNIGGTEVLKENFYNQDIIAIAHWLPFSYA